MSEYLLSFCTPNYNHGKYLATRLKHLLPLLPAHVEYIVIDDASTDNSVELIKKASKGFPNFKLQVNAENQGHIACAPKLIEQARGEYLFFLSADDLLIFENFFEALRLLEEHHPAVLTTDVAHFQDNDSDQYEVHLIKMLDREAPCHFLPSEIPNLLSSNHFMISSFGTFFRKEDVLKAGGYKEYLHHYSDFFLNLEIAFRGGLMYIPNNPAVYARDVPSSFSMSISSAEHRKFASNVLKEIRKLEPNIRELWMRSGVLSHIVKPILFQLLPNPRYWSWIFCMAIRKVKLQKTQLSSIKHKITLQESMVVK